MYSLSHTELDRVQLMDFVQLTKPKIVVLLALTGAVAFILADPHSFDVVDLIIYLLAGYFAAGGAMAVNNAIDYDIDQKMSRTQRRASTGKLSRRAVVLFGSSLFGTGLLICFLYFGFYSTLFLAWGGLFYIIGYSMFLKRNTIFNTIVGGLASPAPVWGAFAAKYDHSISSVSSEPVFLGVPVEGWLLGLLVFLWTPSHTWAMAVKNYNDYCNAKIPMLPVILGIPTTAKLNLWLTIILILFSLYIGVVISQISIIGIAIVSLGFIYSSFKFVRQPTIERGRNNFLAHNVWLALVFLILLI